MLHSVALCVCIPLKPVVSSGEIVEFIKKDGDHIYVLNYFYTFYLCTELF